MFPVRLALVWLVSGFALGICTMFILEHNDYVDYLHQYVEGPRRTTNPFINSKSSQSEAKPMHNLSIASRGESKKTRILCWIRTSPTNLHVRAKSVNDTWGKRCDILLFMSTKADPNFPSVVLDVEEGFEKLWYKTRASLDYIYQHYLNDADWLIACVQLPPPLMKNRRIFLRGGGGCTQASS